MEKNKKFKNPSRMIENALLRLSIFGLLSLVLVQFSLSNNSIKSIIQTNNHDAIAIKESSIYADKGIVELEVEKFDQYAELVFLRNGEPIQDLIIENDRIKIEVYDGDVIELDATDYTDPIAVKVRSVSQNLERPSKNSTYTSDGNIVYLFKTKTLQQP